MTFYAEGFDRDLPLFLPFASNGGFFHRAAALTVFLAFCTVAASGSDRKIIAPGTKTGGNYSQGMPVDGTLYISGQAGEDVVGQISKDFDDSAF